MLIPPAPALESQKAGRLLPYDLRVESLTEPLGLDRLNPSFSWKLKAASAKDRNLSQSSYQILAASKPDLLAVGRADLWDSGVVASDGTYGIAYAGKPLRSGQHVYWRVAVSEKGYGPRWSETAHFSMGLLAPSDWKAQWIAIDAPDAADATSFTGASWIWSVKDKQGSVPRIDRTFVRRLTIQKPGELESAIMDLTADDQFTLFVNGQQAEVSDGRADAWQRPVRVELKPLLKDGANELRVVARNYGEAAAGVLGRLVLKAKSGESTVVVTDAAWTEADGTAATVLGKFGMAPWGTMSAKVLRPATYYRREFEVKPKLTRATAYVTALGLVDLHLNGERVHEDLFNPGWTAYEKRVYYRTFDVTKQMKAGLNAVGAVLGDGWYSGYIGWGGRRAWYGDRPRVKVQLNLEYADGRTETIATDESWRASTGGIREQDFLAGEVFDARLEPSNWDKTGFSASKWQKPYIVTDYKGAVESHLAPPVLPYQRLKPKSVKEVRPGSYILDFGQNLAGFAELRTKGRPGQKITLRFVEKLNPDGTVYTANLRGAQATDHYICKGSGTEEWSPRFTFHGFQYVEVSGLDHAPKPDEVVAVAISTATPEVGTFESSDPKLNQLSSNAWWTQKMNFIDIPTDCPQRDERLGWTGDAQAYIRTATMYSDVQSFFAKWLITLEDEQRADGQFPMVAPLRVAENDGGPAWADAGVICPWTIYDVYGDKRQLAERYESMKRFVEFCRARSTPDLLPPEKFHAFGDWLSINANTPNEVIYEAYFALSARLTAESAEALGKTEDAKTYHKLADAVKAAFNKAYVSNDGVVKGDTQTGYVLAIGFDLVDGEKRKMAADRLVADIEKRGWHLSTGFVGTRDLMHVLSKIGRDDVAFRLLHQNTFPSWMFEIENGATTIWERWDGWTPEKGFQDPGMNSFAHYAYGAVMGWVFERVGGIDNATPGFGKVRIAPAIDPNLTWAKTSYESVRGPIRTEWRKENGKLTLTVEVPPNATAEIRMPTKGGTVKSDGGSGKREANAETFAVGSGTYRFTTDWK